MEFKNDSNKELEDIKWMLNEPDLKQDPEEQDYGDLSQLNTDRSILDTVGKETLKKIAKDTIDLLESSVAVYEKNGDYAMGIFASGWCRKMDSSSRKLCGNCSNKEALESGKWLCHESCWDFSKRALENNEIVDESCEGGINLYAIPIISENETIGVLSVGYGNPPEDEKTLRELSEKYGISVDVLRKNAQEYKKRPKYIEEIAKKRMRTSAELIALLYKSQKGEKILQETQTIYDLAIEGTELGTWHWNVQTGEITINEYWAKMGGYTKEELQPTTIETWQSLAHPEDLKTCTKHLEKHFSGETDTYECQFRMKHKKGHWIWVFDKGKVFEKTPDGKPLLMYGTHQDMTKQKEASEELERFFSINLDLLCIADMDGNFIKINKAWETILGFKVEELEKRKFLDFVHPDDMENTINALSELDKQKLVTNFVNRYRTKDGTYRYIEWHSRPYGKFIYAAARDITERIKNEEALRESEEKFRLMFRYSPVGIINFDKNGVIVDANDSFTTIIGSPRKLLIGLNMLNLPDKKLVAAIKISLKGEQGYYNGEYHATTSGKKVQVRGVFTSIKDNDDNFVMGIGIIEDISEQKKAEKALIKAKEEAQAANKAKSDFLASMSHEIRTPINGVIGFSELLKSTPLSENQKEYNDIVVHSAKSLLGIINDILDFSKIEAGKLELRMEKFDLNEIIDSALSILNFQAVEKNIELVQSISRNVPKFIYADPIRLRQILLNLLSNAVKFTDEGEVELMIRKKDEDVRKKRVRLHFSVRDTGIGIKEEHVQKILEPFNQGNNMITHKYGGTGLGLAITKSLLEKMDSQLTIKSTVGKGSIFSFELELRYEVPTPKPYEVESETIATEDTIPKTDEKKILIVEDNRINMQYLETVLKTENKNLAILNAYDGETGLEMFKTEHPDLILMDSQLPKMNGYQVTGKIREIDKKVPIIAITARAFKDEREKCMEAGMSDYLPKPASISAIKKMLSKYL